MDAASRFARVALGLDPLLGSAAPGADTLHGRKAQPRRGRPSSRARWLAVLATLAAMGVPAAASAQATFRGVGRDGRVTETIAFVDAWEDGPGGPDADGCLDVLTRVEVVKEPARRTTAHLLLLGPWGQHLYTVDEERVTPGMPDTSVVRTSWRAVDLDGDGRKEIVFIERRLVTRVETDERGLPTEEPGPYFADATVKVRYLTREGDALVEHELDAEAGSPAMKALLQLQLGGGLDLWLQLAAADVDFLRERYEDARYRFGVVREQVERQLTAREIDELGPRRPLPGASPDDPPVQWMAATRRIGALPRWYQRR